ncbi:hypothetical protein [Corynebacterium callunae]|nr:hypothetical protein [Corynebacterium callunae]MCK2201513.1 hypothetical protein [Corynebacterium callunae]
MEPMDLNGGRFYARNLLADDRINDIPALSAALDTEVDAEFVAEAKRKWEADEEYTWAVCEQTNVEMLVFARLNPTSGTLELFPTADLTTVLPNDPILEPVTIGDAQRVGKDTISRWAQGFLGMDIKPA